MRRRVAVIAAGLVVIAAAALLAIGRRDHAPAAAVEESAPSVAVARGTLVQSQSLTGALGYGTATTIAGRGAGTVTWLPQPGTVVKRGGPLYRVDDRPVLLLTGDLPLYRTLTDHPQPPAGESTDTGTAAGEGGEGEKPAPPSVPLLRGSDVDLLATNLAALGLYDGPTTDATYGWTLAHAVEEWQESLDEEPTGVVEPGDVVVAHGSVRVDGVTAHLGDDAQEPILTVTATDKVVTLQAAAGLLPSVKVGRRLQVTLPDGTAVATRVTAIGAIADDPNGGPASAPVTVTPLHPAALAKVALGPVTATLVTASVKDVLHVPVAALLALAGGGYALQQPDGTLLPVTIGMVADGEVEVTGVAEGTEVVRP